MGQCVFCRIIAGEISSDFVYKGEDIVAFKDIHPSAPIHILVVTKKHFANLNEVDEQTLGKLFSVLKEVAKKENIVDGYRVEINVGEKGGQVIPHLHIHLKGGF